jgi:hypothetical protein
LDDDEYGAIGGVILTGKSEVLGEKHVAVPLCPPKISHEQTFFFFVKRIFINLISHTTDSSWHSERYTKSTTRVVIEQSPQVV